MLLACYICSIQKNSRKCSGIELLPPVREFPAWDRGKGIWWQTGIIPGNGTTIIGCPPNGVANVLQLG